jgi:uncharacterized protein YjdB
MKRLLIASVSLLITLGALPKSTYSDQNTDIAYQTHVSNQGWTDWVGSGETSGRRGQQLEAIRIRLNGIPGRLQYRAHLADKGWTDWVDNGEVAGSTGESRRMEAIRIKLEESPDYSIRYRAYVNRRGWTPWAENGEVAGTTGQARGLARGGTNSIGRKRQLVFEK